MFTDVTEPATTTGDAPCPLPADDAATLNAGDCRAAETAALTAAFAPKDPIERMLTNLIVTHVHLIDVAARDAFHAETDMLRARARSGVVALDRQLMFYLKELNRLRDAAAEAAAEADAAVPVLTAEPPPRPAATVLLPAATAPIVATPHDTIAALKSLLAPAQPPMNRAARRAANAKLARAERRLGLSLAARPAAAAPAE